MNTSRDPHNIPLDAVIAARWDQIIPVASPPPVDVEMREGMGRYIAEMSEVEA